MEKSTKTLIGLIFATLFIVLAVITLAGMSYPNGFATVGVPITSNYEYTLTITPTSDLSNVTLLVPLPADNTGRDLGTPLMLTDTSDYPEDWNLVLVGTPGEASYLKVTTPFLSAAPEGRGTILHASIPSDVIIPTRNPENGAYLIGADLKQKPDMATADPSRKIFAKFTAEPATITEIMASCTGENTWWWFGSSSNAYTDYISTKIDGSISGWLETTGTPESGIGKYTII